MHAAKLARSTRGDSYSYQPGTHHYDGSAIYIYLPIQNVMSSNKVFLTAAFIVWLPPIGSGDTNKLQYKSDSYIATVEPKLNE